MVAGGNQAVASSWEAGDTQEAKSFKEPQKASAGQSARADCPRKSPHWGCTQELGRLTQLHVIQETGHFADSSLDSNTETTPKTADWSQPVEVDDSLPPSGNPDKTPGTADWSQSREGELRGLPVLDPKVEEVLSGEKLVDDPSMWEYLPKPSFTNTHDWVAWQAVQVAMPTWWPKLSSVPGWRDICRLARLAQVSFQMPQACYAATKGSTITWHHPPPPCLDCDAYLLIKDPSFGSQDYQLNQPQKTLHMPKPFNIGLI